MNRTSGAIDQTADAQRLETPRWSYGVKTGFCVTGGFFLAWAFVQEPHPWAAVAMLGLIAYGLFNVRGLTRPRRLTLHREGFDFRPVVGADRAVRWSDVEGFQTFIVTSLGSGYVSYRLRSTSSLQAQKAPRGLGYFLQPDDLIATLESWRLASR